MKIESVRRKRNIRKSIEVSNEKTKAIIDILDSYQNVKRFEVIGSLNNFKLLLIKLEKEEELDFSIEINMLLKLIDQYQNPDFKNQASFKDDFDVLNKLTYELFLSL